MITNASMFHRDSVRRALEILDQNNGEIWAKLDAGTAEYYHLIERTSIPFQKILDNLLDAARKRPIVIQSLFLKLDGRGPSEHEIGAFCGRLRTIVDGGGSIKSVHVYTVARKPAESNVTPLDPPEVEAIARRVRSEARVPAEAFAGALVS